MESDYIVSIYKKTDNLFQKIIPMNELIIEGTDFLKLNNFGSSLKNIISLKIENHQNDFSLDDLKEVAPKLESLKINLNEGDFKLNGLEELNKLEKLELLISNERIYKENINLNIPKSLIYLNISENIKDYLDEKVLKSFVLKKVHNGVLNYERNSD